MSFKLSKDVNPPCVFLFQWNQLHGRLDAEYNRALLSTRIESVFPSYKVRALTKSRTGGTPSKSRAEYWEGAIPWASPKDFGDFYLTDTEDHISEDAVGDSATALIPAKSLLVVYRSGVLQHSLPVAVTTRETAINQDLKALIPCGGASAEYLGAYFEIFGKRLLPLITKSGATVQSINTAQFDELRIPIPNPEVQTKVVDLLVAAFRRQRDFEAKASQLLATIDSVLLEELGIPRLAEPPNTLESRMFLQHFSTLTGRRWDPFRYQAKQIEKRSILRQRAGNLKKLRHCVSNVIAGDWGADVEDTFDEEKFERCLVIRNTEFDNEFNLKIESGREKYRLVTRKKLRQLDIQPMDLLVEKSGGSIDQPVGRVAILTSDHLKLGPLGYSNFVVKMRARADVVRPLFLYYWLRTAHRIGITESMQAQTSGLRNLITEEYFDQEIPTPTVTVQNTIVRRLEDMSKNAYAFREQASDELEKAKREIEILILGKEAGE
jgi:type I restriction enzyme S subunit